MIKLKPLGARVAIDPTPNEKPTNLDIIIPVTEKSTRGVIVAVGSGRKDEPLTVKVGDSVMYPKLAGTTIKIEGKEYLLMREEEIFAII